MRKLTALFVASTLALGAANLAHAADTTTAAMEEQRKANMLAHMETQNKIYNILTPEQKKQFNANFEKRLTERPAAKGKMPATAE